MNIIQATISDETEVRAYRKIDLMPLTGWPNGKDPYPENQLEDEVMWARMPEHYRLQGEAISSKTVSPGQMFEYGRPENNFAIRTWIVTEAKNRPDSGRFVVEVKAEWYAPAKLEKV